MRSEVKRKKSFTTNDEDETQNLYQDCGFGQTNAKTGIDNTTNTHGITNISSQVQQELLFRSEHILAGKQVAKILPSLIRGLQGTESSMAGAVEFVAKTDPVGSSSFSTGTARFSSPPSHDLNHIPTTTTTSTRTEEVSAVRRQQELIDALLRHRPYRDNVSQQSGIGGIAAEGAASQAIAKLLLKEKLARSTFPLAGQSIGGLLHGNSLNNVRGRDATNKLSEPSNTQLARDAVNNLSTQQQNAASMPLGLSALQPSRSTHENDIFQEALRAQLSQSLDASSQNILVIQNFLTPASGNIQTSNQTPNNPVQRLGLQRQGAALSALQGQNKNMLAAIAANRLLQQHLQQSQVFQSMIRPRSNNTSLSPKDQFNFLSRVVAQQNAVAQQRGSSTVATSGSASLQPSNSSPTKDDEASVSNKRPRNS